MTSQGSRGPGHRLGGETWGRECVPNKAREARMPVYWRTYTCDAQWRDSLMCRRVDRSATEERQEAVKYKMSRTLGRITSLLAKGSTVSQASKSTRSCVFALSISVIEPNESNRFLDAFRRYRIPRYCRPPTIDRRSTIFEGDDVKYRTQRLGRMGSEYLQTEGRDCASPKHTQSGPSRTRWK